MTDKRSLDGKVAIVTGATGLLGPYHCEALSQAGAKVYITDLDYEACRHLSGRIENALPFELDVTNPEHFLKLKEAILAEHPAVDILVNNAAINDKFENPETSLQMSRFENYPLEMWRKSLDVNLTGVFLSCQVFGSMMAERGQGSIINIASTYGIVAPNQALYKDAKGRQMFYKPPAYPATKAAVVHLTRYLAAYWGHNGVRVNCLSPGGVENGQNEQFVKSYSRATPLGRMARPVDYQDAIVFLASESSAYLTGHNLVIDGGFSIW